MQSIFRTVWRMADRSGASTVTVGKRVTLELGFIFPKVSNIAPVPVLKVSLALEASTEPSWVCAITFLIWKVDLVHGMQ